MSTSPARRVLAFALTMLAGVAGGAVAVLVFEARFERGPALQPSAAPVTLAPAATFSERPVDGKQAQQNALLAARLAAVEAQLREQTAPASPREPAPEAPLPRMPEPEEAKQQLEDRMRSLVQGHASDPIDSSWAVRTNRTFSSDFSAMAAEAPLKLVSIDCHTTSCLAKVRWENYAAALGNGAVLAHYAYSTSCARQVVQPPPDDVNAPYESTVVFDCTSARSEHL